MGVKQVDDLEINPEEQSKEFMEMYTQIIKDQKKKEKRGKNPDIPCSDCNGAMFVICKSSTGDVEADLCTCVNQMGNPEDWKRTEQLKVKVANISSAFIPNKYLKAEKHDGIKKEVLDITASILDGTLDNSLFLFHGGTGSGKTHSAAHILLNFLQATEDKTCIYIPTYKYLNLKRRFQGCDFKNPDREKYEAEFNWYNEKIKEADLVVIDELGQETLRPGEKQPIFELIDRRYSGSLPTILISNHCDNRSQSLDGKLLSSMVGARIASRLKAAKSIHFAGPDRRAQENTEVITQAEVENYMFPGKILTHGDDEHHIMTWVARLPAFDTLSKGGRKELTYIDEYGQQWDADRPKESSFKDAWVIGDRLQITGPVCDHEDKKLYGFLVKKLTQEHKSMNPGLTIQSSCREILGWQGKAISGCSVHLLKRQLDRLVRMSLRFTNANGNRWTGPLLTEVAQIGTNSNSQIKISFSHFMISFYRAHEYTTFNKELSQKLLGDSSAFYLFFVSHARQNALMPVPFSKCVKLLGVPDKISRKAALRRISNATKDLFKFGVLDREKTIFKNNSLFPHRGTAL